MSKFNINRRTMLRGMVGGSTIALGLPLLEAMVDAHGEAHADGTELPLRFISYYWADGIVINEWEPPDTGANFTLSPAMASFDGAIRPYISVVSGMRNQYNGKILTHHEGMCGFSGHTIQPTGGLNSNATGPTIDQVIADVPGVADCTPIRAMHTQVSKPDSADGDGGTTTIAMSHRDSGGNIIAQVPEVNPVEVWQNIFGRFVPQADDGDLRTSVLDFVREDAARLKTRLGSADQARLDAHLQGIQELEDKISAVVPTCDLPPTPTETNQNIGGNEPISSVVDAMSDLISFAFACDITRVATVLFKKFVAATVFNEAGLAEQHHSSSHGGPGNQTYRAGVTYQMEKFADLLTKLHGFEDPMGGNLLDSTIIYATSDCSTGASHSIRRQPMIVAGSGRGYLANPGVHYQSTPFDGNDGQPSTTGNMTDVLLTCLQAFDPAAASVGAGPLQSTTPLTDIVA